MSGIVEFCPNVCALAKWHADPVFDGLGQHNCPYRYGVTHAAAIVNGQVTCVHFRPKEVDA